MDAMGKAQHAESQFFGKFWFHFYRSLPWPFRGPNQLKTWDILRPFGILSWWRPNDKKWGRAFFELSKYFLGGESIFLFIFTSIWRRFPFWRAYFSVRWVQPRSSFGYRWCFLYFRYLKWLINIFGCPILDLFNLFFTDCTMVHHHIALPFLRICLELFPIISNKSRVFNDLAHWKGSPFMPAINPLQFIRWGFDSTLKKQVNVSFARFIWTIGSEQAKIKGFCALADY